MGAGGADELHLPGAGLVAVGVARERAHGADVNAHPALFAFERAVGPVGEDRRAHAALADAKRLDVHAFVADAHAAETEDAARVVEVDDGGKLLLGLVLLLFEEAALGGAVAEDHVLQLALAALVAHRAVERVVGEEEFEHGLAGVVHRRRSGAHHHPGLHDDRAGGLELGGFFDFHQAHPAGGLEREPRVIAEGRHFDADRLAGLDEQRSRGGLDGPAVHVQLNRLGRLRHGQRPTPAAARA